MEFNKFHSLTDKFTWNSQDVYFSNYNYQMIYYLFRDDEDLLDLKMD